MRPGVTVAAMSTLRSGGRRRAALALALLTSSALLLSACSSGSSTKDATAGSSAAPGTSTPAQPLAYAGHTSDVYSDPAHWLCRAGVTEEVCQPRLDATVVDANGVTGTEKHEIATDPKVDCFYVYPTISNDQTANSDLNAGPEEKAVTALQFARFNQLCRTFAPVYRQNTLPSLLGSVQSDLTRQQRADIAYADVLDAWKTYIAQDNGGRGVILVGHSQGSGMLTRLIKEEIDPNPTLRSHLIGAYLLGTSLRVPQGETVGGELQNVPLCTSTAEVGCVVAYASFRSTSPPPTDSSLFGRTSGDGMEAACVNPAAPGGGSAAMVSYFQTGEIETNNLRSKLRDDVRARIDTPFTKLDGVLQAQCVSKDGFRYLEVTVPGLNDPSAAVQNVPGDLTPAWGLHLIDADLAMGSMLAMADAQTQAYLAKQ